MQIVIKICFSLLDVEGAGAAEGERATSAAKKKKKKKKGLKKKK